MQNTTLDKGHSVQNILTDGKVAGATAIATVSSGVSGIMEVLPTFLTLIATFLGAVLSTVLIYNHLKKGRLERRALKLEILRGEQALKNDRRPHKESNEEHF